LAISHPPHGRIAITILRMRNSFINSGPIVVVNGGLVIAASDALALKADTCNGRNIPLAFMFRSVSNTSDMT